MAHNNLSTYPGFNVTLKSHTNASAFQLGLFIRNKGKPIVFYSIKLTSDQQQYTVTEKELLSVVETKKEFRNILLGQILIIYTYHKNLTCNNFNTNMLLRWRLILEDYVPDIEYIKVETNIVEDVISRFPLNRNQ